MNQTATHEEIAKQLESIHRLLENLFASSRLKQEHLLLTYIRSLCGTDEQFTPIATACTDVLENVQSIDYDQTTLIDEVKTRLDAMYVRALPSTWFDKDVLYYKIGYALAEDAFLKLPTTELSRHDRLFLNNLQRSVQQVLVKNPNLLGDNPYYKRHYGAFQAAKQTTRTLLAEDFANTISYFKGD